MPYSVLLDSGTNCVLAVSGNVSAIVFAHENIRDTWHIYSANYPNYLKKRLFAGNPFFLAEVPADSLPKWTWSKKTRTFSPTRVDVLTDVLRAKSRLAAAQVSTIAEIMRSLSSARYKLRTGVDFQDVTYQLKREQAQKFKDAEYNEEISMLVPFVVQYADFAGLSLKDAADDILFKAKLDDEVLLKTEGLRLKYFDLVKKASDPEELPKIYQDFLRDYYLNAEL